MTTGSRSAAPGVSWGRTLGLALGWLLLLAYAAWLIHNALPWLQGTPLPSQAPAIIARLIALPPALAVPGVSLPPLLAVLAVALFVILVALSLNRASASSQPASPAEPAPIISAIPQTLPEPASSPALTPHAETPAPADPPLPAEASEPAPEPAPPAPEDMDSAPDTSAEEGAASEIVAADEVVIVEPSPPEEPAAPAPVTPSQPAPKPPQRQTTNSRRVFISSTSRDLVKHRMRLYSDLKGMDDEPIAMEDFGASPDDATTVSLEELSTADVVVLIVAWRYGFVPDGQTRSVTEQEYDAAKALRLPSGKPVPVYVFLANPATEADDGPDALFPAETRDTEHAAQLDDFRARLSDPNSDVPDFFDSPADLSARVLRALGRRAGRAPAGSQYALVAARDLDRTTFSMGDDEAANLPYLTAPVQDAWDAATTALAHARERSGRGKRGIIVLGEASAGKTRLALEALMATLPDWPTLRWYESSSLSELRAGGPLPEDGLVLFIDNLDRFPPATRRESGGAVIALASNPAATLRELVESIRGPLVIVATCRTEGEGAVRSEMTWLFDKLLPVTIPQFDTNRQSAEAQDVIAAFAAEGVAHREDYDGTIGSLTLGLSAKRGQYHDLETHERPAVEVLRAMKLLYTAGVFQHTERRVRAVCGQIFHHLALAEDARVWDDACEYLLSPQFVEITNDARDGRIALVIRKDAYFEKVIDDYPNPRDPGQGNRHLAALVRVFATLNDMDGLFELAGARFGQGDYSTTLTAMEEALALNPQDADAWVNKGVALGALGQTEEALAAYERALALNPQHASAWYNKGVALGALGQTEEALVAYERALALNPQDADAWYNKGMALRALGQTEEALAAFERALALDPQDAIAWNAR
ncbi:MAG TPA: tetratricopeptide repeat protein, partial [Ktedonobacterales bacterium]